MTVGTLPRDRGLINIYISDSQLSNKCPAPARIHSGYIGGGWSKFVGQAWWGGCRLVCVFKNGAAPGCKNVKAASLSEHEGKIAEWVCPAANEIVPK